MESRRSKAMAAQKNGRRSNQERKMALIQDEQSRSGCTRTEKARHWRWISWDVLLTYCSRMQTLHPWCFCVFHFLTWHHINSTISFIEENNAGNAAAALMARLAPKAKDLPTTVFLLVKLTQRHLRLPGISMRRSGEWGDHLTLQAAADKGIAYAQSNVNKSKKKN
ncbi:uncharacterized protein [Arachis hypogaea]|uniref:uncharacterized protein isoform X5 n=1 Tax=Arachis hypogaea TaxID=3818 RepID=UPI000DEC4A73|nr:uncharacterized protein LOC112795909 isoform X8 [Arachis hypogaea]